MSQTILVGIFEGFSWIRSEGRGSFMNSPQVKAFGDARIADGETCVVVDLGGCTAMDSTFMGTMAGLVSRVSELEGGVLQVADAGERNRRSLEDLGLDHILEIDPASAEWIGCLEPIRDELQELPESGDISDLERSKLSLEAHKRLLELNKENKDKFEDVVDMMEKEVADKETQENEAEAEAEAEAEEEEHKDESQDENSV